MPPAAPFRGFINQFLIVDEGRCSSTGVAPHFPQVREAVQRILGDPARLRWVGFSHVDADECGALHDWLAAAPRAQPVCSQVAAMVSVGDLADRAPRPLGDGEELALGATKRVRWLDAPHLPHNWECGYLFEASTRTLLCGDLFTHAGADVPG